MQKLKWLILVLIAGEMVWLWQTKKIEPIINLIEDKLYPAEVKVNTNTGTVVDDEKEMIQVSEKADLVPTKVVTPTKKIISPTPTPDSEPWGVAKQVDEVTWTMKIGEDEKMATSQEVFDALNAYRQRYGSQILTWDTNLGNYAQTRAKYLNSIKNVDKHEGFTNFVNNEDGFNKLGFTMLGENISYGYKLNGVHVIEWMYAGDEPHNNNQLDTRWDHVGIGVDGLATCLIFGTGKM